MSIPNAWVLTVGHIGMENQGRGLAERLGLDPAIKRLWPRAPWRYLPPRLWPAPLRSPGAAGDALAPPWPDLLISCGKRSTAPALAIRRASGGRTFAVHISDPRMPAAKFDLLVVSAHDKPRGDNVVVVRGTVHRVTQAQIDAAARQLEPRLKHLPRPLIAVLIGGSNRKHKMHGPAMERFAGQLAGLCRDAGAGLLITTSRRTGAGNEAILRRRLAGLPAEIWDGSGDNPYFGYLGLADAIVVSADSVSMVSEACSTGKPVHVARLASLSRRLEAFHAGLQGDGLTRPFAGALEDWRYDPLDDTGHAAAEVAARMQARGFRFPGMK
ncbi:MAG: mitochondrial fission ELM1 family protein [Alphaproteobacteria bacterium]